MKIPTWLIVTVMIFSFFSVNIILLLFCAVWLLGRWVGVGEPNDYDYVEDEPQSGYKHTKRETGFAVYRIYGSNRTYLGTWTSPNMAISNAESALRRSSKNTAVIVTDKETGGTIWSDNK